MVKKGKSRTELGVERLKSLLETNKFTNDLKRIRDLGRTDSFEEQILFTDEIARLVKQYNLPGSFYPIVEHLVTTGHVDESLAEPPVSVVSHKNKTVKPNKDPEQVYRIHKHDDKIGIELSIGVDATKQEIIDFVDQYYSSLIRPLQEELGAMRRAPSIVNEKAKRRIIDAIKKDGLSAMEVANKFGMSKTRVHQIVKEMKE